MDIGNPIVFMGVNLDSLTKQSLFAIRYDKKLNSVLDRDNGIHNAHEVYS